MRIRPIYNVKQAIINLWRNGTNSLGSIFIMTFTFAILGIVFSLVLNINNIVQNVHDEYEEIVVYLDEDLGSDQISKTYEDIKSIVGVTNVKYITKDAAFEKMKSEWGEDAYLLEDITESPLTDEFVIRLKDLSYTKSVVEIIQTFKGIEKVKYYKDVIDKLILVSKVIGQIGLAIIVVLLLLCFFVISNAVNIAVNSRRVEINIMKFVGAKNHFIRVPFIIEGVLIGLISALVSSVVVYFAYSYMIVDISEQFLGYVQFLEDPLPVEAIIKHFIYIVSVLGVGLGTLGAIRSTGKHLKV